MATKRSKLIRILIMKDLNVRAVRSGHDRAGPFLEITSMNPESLRYIKAFDGVPVRHRKSARQ